MISAHLAGIQIAALLALGAGCSQPPEQGTEPAASAQAGGTTMSVLVKSGAFQHGGAIPKRHTDDGEDLSPPLSWSHVPPGTRELAVVVDDPDAPRSEPWVHWLIYGVAPDADGLSEGIPQKERVSASAGAVQGKNSWGTIGYRGPAPPKGHGTHHYHFKVYALDAALALEPGLDKAQLLKAISGHVLGQGEVEGTYAR